MNECTCGADYLERASLANKELTEKVKRLQSELKDARNELCLKCGAFSMSHLGSCDDCRFRHGGEWSKDMEE